MTQTYDVSELNTGDPTSIEWGLAWVRFIARDVPYNGVFPQYSISDEEWIALLGLSKSGDNYYPHITVAEKILSDPTYATQINEDGYSATYRNPVDLAAFIRTSYGKQLSSLYPAGTTSTTSFAPYF